MTAEFNWWLLLLGLVVGGGLTWLVLAETRRREQDVEDAELPEEAVWIEARMAEEGAPADLETIERVVQLHRAYLSVVPPGAALDDDWADEPGRSFEEPWIPPADSAGHEHAGEVDLPLEPAPPEDTAVRHEVRNG
jgi:hypothetical protein